MSISARSAKGKTGRRLAGCTFLARREWRPLCHLPRGVGRPILSSARLVKLQLPPRAARDEQPRRGVPLELRFRGY